MGYYYYCIILWIEYTFTVDIIAVKISTVIENQLTELPCDKKFKQMFREIF